MDFANRDNMIIYLAAEGKTNAQIGEALDIDPATVRLKLTDERVAFEVKRMRYKLYGADHKKRFESILPHALDVTETILLDANAKSSLRFAAAQEVMDRTLGKPKQTVEHEGSLVRALFEKLDGKKPVIEVGGEPTAPENERPALTLIENPNEKVAVDVSKNPNLSDDPIDNWVNKNL